MMDQILTDAGYKYEGMRHNIHTYVFVNKEGIKVTVEVPDKCTHLTMPVKSFMAEEVPTNSKDLQNQDYTEENFKADAEDMQKRMDRAQKKQDKAVEAEKKNDDADSNRLFTEAQLQQQTAEIASPKPLKLSKAQMRKQRRRK